jgi:rubrerythrin
MDLKGSKTEKNLLAAFAGESQARNRYTFLLQFGEGYTSENRVITGCVFENWQKGSATEYAFFP